MALCVDVSTGTLVVSPTQGETDCTSYILTSADEYHRLGAGIFSGVELADVVEASGLIVLCWIVAFGFKNARRAL